MLNLLLYLLQYLRVWQIPNQMQEFIGYSGRLWRKQSVISITESIGSTISSCSVARVLVMNDEILKKEEAICVSDCRNQGLQGAAAYAGYLISQ